MGILTPAAVRRQIASEKTDVIVALKQIDGGGLLRCDLSPDCRGRQNAHCISEGLEYRADNGSSELCAHALEGRGVLLEKCGRVDRGTAARGVVVLAERHAGV